MTRHRLDNIYTHKFVPSPLPSSEGDKKNANHNQTEGRMKAWHFISGDKRLRYDDNRIVRAGKTYKATGDLSMCENGMHGSKRIIDALRCAPGPIICRVELSCEIETDNDKSVARERAVLWMIDGANVLHEFACRVALEALTVAKVTDKRSWAAIEAKRRWVRGEITDAELAAAGAAARAAARAAAWAAAGDAARDAARDKQNRILTGLVVAEHKRTK